MIFLHASCSSIFFAARTVNIGVYDPLVVEYALVAAVMLYALRVEWTDTMVMFSS